MFEPGQTFARFKILEKIGEGGMGAVFLAEDTKLHRNVALKVLLKEAFDDKTRRERFKREAKTAAQVSHGNVMSIYDIDSFVDKASGEEYDFIVMEYIKGQSLSDYMQVKKPSMDTILRLAERIASGLSAAHKLNIVHRDIKADNIIIDEDNEPKILDFGLAKPVEATFESDGDDTQTVDSHLTQAGKIVGTISYMSPEQAKGEPVDVRSDIFAFGVLVYRMVTEEFPFTGPTQVSTIAKILESQYEPPRQKNDQIPPELERIIDKCLQKHPEDRYQDTRDLEIDLRNLRRRYEGGMSDTISAEFTLPEAKKSKSFVFRLSNWQLLSVLGLTIVLVAVAYKYFSNPETSLTQTAQATENALAILSFENKTNDENLDWLETALPEILLTDLAQADILKVISRERVLDCLPLDKRTDHTFDECVSAADDLGAAYVLSGTFIKLGDQIRINANVEETGSRNMLYGLKVVGVDPLVLIDSLTLKIASALGLQEKVNGDDKNVSTFVSSPEAYQAYQNGMKRFYQEYFDEAIEQFNKAIELDSSFALPYMRIGMTNIFTGKQTEGARYFALAKERENNLPRRDKQLLDVYADLWLTENYNNAFIKLESFVNSYPNDKEGLVIYGLLVRTFQQDVDRAMVYIDSALKLDPTFQFALSQASSFMRNEKEYDKALEYAELNKKYHSNSPEPYIILATIYQQMERYDEAIEELLELIKMDSNNRPATLRLTNLYIIKNDFDKARFYLDEYKRIVGDDPFFIREYYYQWANLMIWQGKLKQSMDYRFKAVEYALESNDSNAINAAYNAVARYYMHYDMLDSAAYFYEKAHDYSRTFQDFDYYFSISQIDPELGKKIRPDYMEVLTNFKKRIPSDLWFIADYLEVIYDSHIERDTASVVDNMLALRKAQNTEGEQREIAMLQVKIGRYEEAIPILENYVSGVTRTANGYAYLTSLYYLGVAYENLGETQKAIDYFTEVLSYWGNIDLPIEESRGAKAHLAKLTG